MSSETYIETIEFRAVAPKTNLRGLDEALQKLNALDAAWRSLQARASGMMQPVMFKKTTADIREAIAAAEKMGRFGKSAGGSYKPASLAPADLAKALGYDPKQLQNFLTQGLVGGKSKAAQEMRRQVREIYSVAQGEFRNVAGASKGIAMFTKHFDPRQDPMAALRMMFGAPAGGAPMSAQAALASAAKVEREHRTSNIQHPTSNVESEDRSKAKQFADTLAAIKRQLAESLNTGDLQKVASARKQAAAKARALVGEKAIPGSGKKYDDAMAWAAGQERQAVETTQKIIMQQGQNLAQLQLDKAKAIAAGDKETGRMLKQQEVALKKSMAEGQKSLRALDQAIYRPLTARQAQREKQAQQVAEIERQQTARRNQMQAVQLQWQTFMAQPGAVEGMRSGRMTLDKQGRWTRTLEGQRPLPGGQMEYFRGSLGQTATMERGRAPVPQDRLGAAVGGLGLRNMAANFVKVASWAVAAIPVYAAMSKGVDLASYSLHRLIETGAETAHLGVVFRGVGGSAQELTNDIIKLAAVEGRETSEMMASATEWARLGGDRKAINEEVRVSAMAANIANMHMSETTRQLSALMHIYGMEAGDLNGVLGMLVNTSLKYNVTLEDLFMGLDRSAGAAKVAGVGLAELQGMIGTVVGKTGQSGIVVGNTIKSLLVQFSNPAIQRQLRGFGIEVLGNNLQQKSGSQIFGRDGGEVGHDGQPQQAGPDADDGGSVERRAVRAVDGRLFADPEAGD